MLDLDPNVPYNSTLLQNLASAYARSYNSSSVFSICNTDFLVHAQEAHSEPHMISVIKERLGSDATAKGFPSIFPQCSGVGDFDVLRRRAARPRSTASTVASLVLVWLMALPRIVYLAPEPKVQHDRAISGSVLGPWPALFTAPD